MSKQLQVGQKYKRYSNETISHALSLVRTNAMSLREASRTFNIPKSTLSDKLQGKSEVGCKSGPPTVLSEMEEQLLADWIQEMSMRGFGRTREELLDTVQIIIKQDGRPSPFTNSRPGKDWYYGFLKRHPNISTRAPQQLAKERAVITPQRVNEWFEDFKTFVSDEVNDPLLWKDPTRWFNADESGFPLCPKSGKVLAPKGVPNIYNFTSSDKTQITVLACMNAAGLFLKPLIVYAGQRFSYNPLAEFPDAVFGRTNTGWMDSELFHTWLKDVFEPALVEHSVKRPVVLFVDGHSTHSTLSASKVCRDNNIVLYCLLEHGSHLMQPCDVGLFSTLKTTWRQAVRNFQIKNVGDFVTRSKFAGVFKEAWSQACTVQVSVNGFRECGLFPFDPSKVLGTLKLEPSKTFTVSRCLQRNTPPTITDLSPPVLLEKTADAPFETVTALTKEVDVSPNTQDNNDNFIDNVSSKSTAMSSETIEERNATLLNSACSTVNSENVNLDSSTAEQNTIIQVTTGLQTEAKILTPIICNTVSPVLKEVLKIPTANNTQKIKKPRMPLPKAISGKKFHDLLEKKQKEKEEELVRKEARKREREEQRKRRDEEKLKKAEEKAKKKLFREQEKENKRKMKEIEKLEKVLKRKHQDDGNVVS